MEHLMTSEEIAEMLHVDPVTIRRLVNKGDLSAYRIGADYRFAPSDLQDYLQRQRIPARIKDEPSTNPNHPFSQFIQLLEKAIQGKPLTPSESTDRFGKFTKRARNVLALAQEESVRLQHKYIGTEHLLLGLVREGEGVAAQVLHNLGIELSQVRQTIEEIIGRGDSVVYGEIRLTPRAKKVIELAVDEARRLNHRFIGTEHILLGLIREGDGVAAHSLEKLGLQLEQVRTETMRTLSQHQQEKPSSVPSVPPEASTLVAEEEQGLTCTQCGARSPSYFNYCFNCGQSFSRHEAPHE